MNCVQLMCLTQEFVNIHTSHLKVIISGIYKSIIDMRAFCNQCKKNALCANSFNTLWTSYHCAITIIIPCACVIVHITLLVLHSTTRQKLLEIHTFICWVWEHITTTRLTYSETRQTPLDDLIIQVKLVSSHKWHARSSQYAYYKHTSNWVRIKNQPYLHIE